MDQKVINDMLTSITNPFAGSSRAEVINAAAQNAGRAFSTNLVGQPHAGLKGDDLRIALQGDSRMDSGLSEAMESGRITPEQARARLHGRLQRKRNQEIETDFARYMDNVRGSITHAEQQPYQDKFFRQQMGMGAAHLAQSGITSTGKYDMMLAQYEQSLKKIMDGHDSMHIKAKKAAVALEELKLNTDRHLNPQLITFGRAMERVTELVKSGLLEGNAESLGGRMADELFGQDRAVMMRNAANTANANALSQFGQIAQNRDDFMAMARDLDAVTVSALARGGSQADIDAERKAGVAGILGAKKFEDFQ